MKKEKNYLEVLRRRFALIVSLPANDIELARAAWDHGADVVKVHINIDHHASKTHFGSFEDEKEALSEIIRISQGPCGIVPGANPEAALQDYAKALSLGFDFISLYTKHTPAVMLQDPRCVHMLALDAGYAVHDVRALEHIGADVLEASVMKPEAYGQALVAEDLLHYHTICSNTGLPVVVPTQKKIMPDEVYALKCCGVSAVMVGAVVTGRTVASLSDSVQAFRRAIDIMEV